MNLKRRESCEAALTESRRARRRGDYRTAWTELERARVLGRLPAGNTGRAGVSACMPMPISEELRSLL